jgi:membrane protease YdiL (CAAX protease family)
MSEGRLSAVGCDLSDTHAGPSPLEGRAGGAGRTVLLFELLGLFVVVPLLLLTEVVPLRFRLWVLVGLMPAALLIARLNRADLRDLGLAEGAGAEFRRCLFRGLAVWMVLVGGVAAVHWLVGLPAFGFLIDHPDRFAEIAMVYAVSVTAQELLFRGYFFWRYRPLLSRRGLAVANCLVFAWVHIIYGTWISVALSGVGGVVFTGLYLRHGSLAAVGIVHAAFGLAVFAMGYGRYFLPPQ